MQKYLFDADVDVITLMSTHSIIQEEEELNAGGTDSVPVLIDMHASPASNKEDLLEEEEEAGEEDEL